MKALIWGLWLVDRFHLVVRMVVFRFPRVHHSLGEQTQRSATRSLSVLLRAVDVTPLTEGIHCDQHCLSLCAPSVILRAVQVLFSVG